MKSPANYERLKNLPAIEAIKVWLEGDFTIGEGAALLHAIRTGTKTALSDDSIEDAIFSSMDAGEDSETCLLRIQGKR